MTATRKPASANHRVAAPPKASARAPRRTAAMPPPTTEALPVGPAAKAGHAPVLKAAPALPAAKLEKALKSDKEGKADKLEKIDKAEKSRKPKLVRDSFTIPKAEYQVLDALKERSARLARPVKKSELLRAGIKALASMADAQLLAALQAVPAIKTGRPKAGDDGKAS